MSDIVERLKDANGELLMVGNDFSDPLLDAAKEIESLRQQENEWKNLSDELMMRLGQVEEELATLKQSQGEPVAIVSVDAYDVNNRFWDGKSTKEWDTPAGVPSVFWFKPISEVGTKLYTSAPTIPEGWQIVPKTATASMVEAWISGDTFADGYAAMLTAAPAGPRPTDYKPEKMK